MTHKIAAAMAMIVGMGLFSADASMKQMEIKGKVALDGYTISYNEGATIRGGGSDAVAQMDVDLDFKMKFSQDVSARLDLEMDNATAGDGIFSGKTPATAGTTGNRFELGIDQAYFKLNDFLFKNFALTIGKQNLNFSLRDNQAYSWSYGDPIAVVGTYSTRDTDVRLYWAKISEDDLNTATNDNDQSLVGSYVEYWLNDDSLVIGYLNYKSMNATPENILHYGIGIDYFIGESLELYGEVAGQSIDQTNADGSGLQLGLGVEYAFSDFDMKPTVNAEYYLQSGDSTGTTDPDGWEAIVSGKQSAENHSLFVEKAGARDANFNAGLLMMDGTGGYSVIRLNGWISPTKATKVGLGLHMFTDEDESDAAHDDMGLEIDLTGTWKYSQDVTFIAGAFMWTGAEGDGSNAGTDPVTGLKADIEDVVGLMVGSALSF